MGIAETGRRTSTRSHSCFQIAVVNRPLHQLLVYLLKLFAFLALGCSAQTWDVNALSRCNSKFRITSSKDLPAGALEGLKTQAHSEQPQPRKRLSSIQMSLRVAAITGGRQNLGSGYFVPFSCPLLLEYAASFSALKWPSAGIGATCCFDTPQSKSSAKRVWVPPCTFGGKHAQTADESAPRLTDAFRLGPVHQLGPEQFARNYHLVTICNLNDLY